MAVVLTLAKASISAASTSVSLVNDIISTLSDTTLLLCFWAIEGAEAPEAENACLFDIGGTDQVGVLIHDTGSTGSNGGVRILIYGFINPGEVTNANVRVNHQFSADQVVALWVNVSGTDTTSVGEVVNYHDDDVNAVPTQQASLIAAGDAGNRMVAFGVAQSNASGPASFSNFSDVTGGVTAATTDDFYYRLSSAGAPSPQTLITWADEQQNAAVLIEIIAAAGGGGGSFISAHHSEGVFL